MINEARRQLLHKMFNAALQDPDVPAYHLIIDAMERAFVAGMKFQQEMTPPTPYNPYKDGKFIP